MPFPPGECWDLQYTNGASRLTRYFGADDRHTRCRKGYRTKAFPRGNGEDRGTGGSGEQPKKRPGKAPATIAKKPQLSSRAELRKHELRGLSNHLASYASRVGGQQGAQAQSGNDETGHFLSVPVLVMEHDGTYNSDRGASLKAQVAMVDAPYGGRE